MGNPKKENAVHDEVRIAFEKDQHYTDFFAEGAFGGITPSGLVHFDLYCDQAPVPKAFHYMVDEDGNIGPEISSRRELDAGIVRLIKAGVTMHPPAAEALARWLQEKVDLLKAAQEGKGDDESPIS